MQQVVLTFLIMRNKISFKYFKIQDANHSFRELKCYYEQTLLRTVDCDRW